MKPEQNHKEAEILAARARITVPAERLNSLPAGLALTKQLFSERLLKHDADLRSQVVLAKLVPGARHVIATRSGHYIQLDQPRLVTREIRRVVRPARRR